MRRLCLGMTCLLLCLGLVSAQECKKMDYNSDLQQYMEKAVQDFSACQPKTEASCRSFLAKALEHVYGVKDFGGGDKYSTAREIADKVKDDPGWEHVGSASDQDALKKAASGAGCGRAAIAVLPSDSGQGHVAIVLPGALSHSGKWKLDVPGSASFFMHKPSNSYSGKPLSYAFPDNQGIEIYVKK